jgi:hypothetical protein
MEAEPDKATVVGDFQRFALKEQQERRRLMPKEMSA